LIDRVIFSTENDRIADVASRYGAEVYKRPVELAADNIPLTAVTKHAMEMMDRSGYRADIVDNHCRKIMVRRPLNSL